MNTVSSIAVEAVRRSREFFGAGHTQSVAWRAGQLRRVLSWLEKNEPRLLAALDADLGKPALEAYASEILTVKMEIRHVLRHLPKWARDKRVGVPWYLWPARSWIRSEPYGVALILAPWNYPLYLLLMPLVAAVAAGNTVVLKPSEFAPNTAEMISELTIVLELGLVQVVTGDATVARELLEQPVDFIFFTGGSTVGRSVGVAAAKRGVPCVLELGGKNPCLIERSAPLALTARRLAWGKFFNAGQTCLAPDYVLVPRDLLELLIVELKKALQEFYGADPLQSPDLARLVNARQWERLRGFLSEGRVVHGGRVDAESLRMEPTILVDLVDEASLWSEEIFGPILPVIAYDDLESVLVEWRSQPAPLALYLYTDSREVERRVLMGTHSGSVCINDHIMQASVHELPFGGVGASGMGRYHGSHGFATFSHARSVLRQSLRMDNPLRYPPGEGKLNWIRRLIG